MKALLAIAFALAALPALADESAAAPFARCPGGPPQVDVRGRPISADFFHRGPVLAVLWSVDCAFCQRHNQRLNALAAEIPGAAVLGVSVDGDAAAVRRTVEKRGYGFPVVVDGSGGCALRPQLTPRRLVPMTCWLGTAPTAPRCIPGEMSDDDLRELLRAQARSSRQS